MATGKQLLDSIKHTLLQFRERELRGIATWKKGILPPVPAFPVCNLFPSRVNYNYRYSGGKYEARWGIDIEFFAIGRTPTEAMDQVRSYLHSARDIIKQYFKWDGLSIDTEIPMGETPEGIVYQHKFLQVGVLPIEIISYEFKPEERLTLTEYRETSSVELGQRIFDRLVAQKTQTAFSLREVNYIERAKVAPIPSFPAIVVLEPTTEYERMHTGLDHNARQFTIDIYTRLADKEINLDINLDLVEKVIDILQVYYTWGGTCYNSEVMGVEFIRDSRPSEVGGMVYSSSIRYTCLSAETSTESIRKKRRA